MRKIDEILKEYGNVCAAIYDQQFLIERTYEDVEKKKERIREIWKEYLEAKKMTEAIQSISPNGSSLELG